MNSKMFKNDLYLYGEETVKIPLHLNFGKYVLDHLKRNINNGVALINGQSGETMTYRELTEYAVKLSVSLAQLGVRRGDVVGLGYHRAIEHIPITLAVTLAGATYTIFVCNGEPDGTTLKHKLEISKPKYLIVSAPFWEVHRDELKSCEHIETFITLDNELEDAIPIKSLLSSEVDVERFLPAHAHGQDDVVAIYYTSGTTGNNKGAQFSHYTCLSRLILNDMFNDESLQTIFVEPAWHAEIANLFALNFLILGRKVVFASETAPDIILKCFQDYKVNVTKITPPLLDSLCYAQERANFNVDSLKAILTASCVLHPATWLHAQKRFPKVNVHQFYGSTEVGNFSSSMTSSESYRWNPKDEKFISVGRISPHCTIKIVDPETDKVLGPNQRGEVYSKSSSTMKGYIGQDISSYMDEDGFWKSGDMAYYDHNGYIFLLGRYVHMISYKGYKIPHSELEDLLLRHPGVRDVAVVGKPVPIYGEVPTAFVVRHHGSDVTEQQLVDFVALKVDPLMKLRGGVRFVTELPKNALLKVLRNRLVEQLTEEGDTAILH